jgi:hypothetical protein
MTPFRNSDETRSEDALEAVRRDNEELRERLAKLEAEATADARARPWRRWGRTTREAQRTQKKCIGLGVALLVVNAWTLYERLSSAPCPADATCYTRSPFGWEVREDRAR